MKTLELLVTCITIIVTYVNSQSPSDPILGFCQFRIQQRGEDYYRLPGYCNIFVHCNLKTKPEYQPCATGTFFNDSTNSCQHASEVDCPDDPCGTGKLQDGKRYTDRANCSLGFYECKNKKSYYERCPLGQIFNVTGCIVDSTCNGGITPLLKKVPVPGCKTMYADLTINSRYYVTDQGRTFMMDCPGGLVFDIKTCGCDWPDKSQISQSSVDRCKSVFTFLFDGDFSEKSKRVYMTTSGSVYIINNTATFESNGQAMIPYLKNVELRSNFALEFTFNYDGNSTDNVTILSNQFEGTSYSIKVQLSVPNLLEVMLLLTDGSSISLVATDVDPTIEHHVRLGKSNDLLKLQVDNQSPVLYRTQANVAPQFEPLVLGSADTTNPFTGYIDDLSLYRCQPAQFYL